MNRDRAAGETPIVGRGGTTAQARGIAAEGLAEAHLARHGVQVLARRVRCRGGEIDLICRDGATLVFVEVRLRAPGRFGSAADSITATKRARIVHAARWWLAGAGRAHARRPMRFDAVVLERLEAQAPQWIRAAFDADAT
jgi:putative endonuclease